jgi:hypothetical protein
MVSNPRRVDVSRGVSANSAGLLSIDDMMRVQGARVAVRRLHGSRAKTAARKAELVPHGLRDEHTSAKLPRHASEQTNAEGPTCAEDFIVAESTRSSKTNYHLCASLRCREI